MSEGSPRSTAATWLEESERAAADAFDEKKRSLLGPISETDVKEAKAMANLGAISDTHEQVRGGNKGEMVVKKSFIQASTDEAQTFKQKDIFTPEPPAPPREALGGLLKWPETDAMIAAREKRDEAAREAAHNKALAMNAEHKQARDARIDATFERARSQDLSCLALMNEWILDTGKVEQLSSSGLVEGENVIATLPVVGVVDGPREVAGKIGPGSLCLTRLPDKEVATTNKDGTKQVQKVPRHRLHFLIQESTSSFGFKEFAEFKKALVQKEDFGKPKPVLTHGLKKVAEKEEVHSAERAAVVQATRTEHMVVGAYSVMKVDDEFFHAHAEWQDTAKLSAYFEGKAETSSSSERIRVFFSSARGASAARPSVGVAAALRRRSALAAATPAKAPAARRASCPATSPSFTPAAAARRSPERSTRKRRTTSRRARETAWRTSQSSSSSSCSTRKPFRSSRPPLNLTLP